MRHFDIHIGDTLYCFHLYRNAIDVLQLLNLHSHLLKSLICYSNAIALVLGNRVLIDKIGFLVLSSRFANALNEKQGQYFWGVFDSSCSLDESRQCLLNCNFNASISDFIASMVL